jgi:hypothetical protein
MPHAQLETRENMNIENHCPVNLFTWPPTLNTWPIVWYVCTLALTSNHSSHLSGASTNEEMLYNYGITYSMMFIIINKSICKYYVLCRVYFIRLEDVNSVLHKTYFLTLFCLCNEAPSFGVRILESLEHFCWVVGSCGSVWTLPAHPTNFHIYVFTWTPILS